MARAEAITLLPDSPAGTEGATSAAEIDAVVAWRVRLLGSRNDMIVSGTPDQRLATVAGQAPSSRRLRIAFVVHDYNRHGGHSRYVAELRGGSTVLERVEFPMNLEPDSGQKIGTLAHKKILSGSYKVATWIQDSNRQVLGRDSLSFQVKAEKTLTSRKSGN